MDNKATKPTNKPQTVQAGDKPEESDEEKKAAEYREFGGNLFNRVGYAMQLIGQGFQDMAKGNEMGRDEVAQGLKELNREVKELDNLDPPEDKKEVNKKLVRLVTVYRDTVKQALAAADKGDADALFKLTKRLNELNEEAKKVAEEVWR